MEKSLDYYNVCKIEFCAFNTLHTCNLIMIHNVCTECLITMEEVATDYQANDTVTSNHLVATNSVHQQISQPEGN